MSRIVFGALFCLACIISANTTSTEQKECPEFCSENYEPVCATDGKTNKKFGNSCELNAQNCVKLRNGSQPFSVTDDVWCDTVLVEHLGDKLRNMGKPECLNSCPFIYAPVCIANNKYHSTISSACEIDVYNCLLETNDTAKLFRILKEEQC